MFGILSQTITLVVNTIQQSRNNDNLIYLISPLNIIGFRITSERILFNQKIYSFLILIFVRTLHQLSVNTNCKLSHIEDNNKLSLENYIFKVNS